MGARPSGVLCQLAPAPSWVLPSGCCIAGASTQMVQVGAGQLDTGPGCGDNRWHSRNCLLSISVQMPQAIEEVVYNRHRKFTLFNLIWAGTVLGLIVLGCLWACIHRCINGPSRSPYNSSLSTTTSLPLATITPATRPIPRAPRPTAATAVVQLQGATTSDLEKGCTAGTEA